MISDNYPESVEESGRYLQIVLGAISRHELPYNPIVYSCWYEYASGRNEPLVQAINKLLDSKQMITVEQINRIYITHVFDSNALLAEKKINEFQIIISEMIKHMAGSGANLVSQSQSLEDYATEISKTTVANEITEIANKIALTSKDVVDSTRKINKRLYATSLEIESLKKELDGIRLEAKIDILTRLLNRRGLDEAMYDLLGQGSQDREALSIVMLDIDFFKTINDWWGHLVGDNVLKTLGKILKDFIKEHKGVAGRFGGDEFILLLPGMPHDSALAVAEKIRSFFTKMKWKNRKTGESIGTITLSLGIAQCTMDDTAESLINRADEALYYAKEHGRNRTATEKDLSPLT